MDNTKFDKLPVWAKDYIKKLETRLAHLTEVCQFEIDGQADKNGIYYSPLYNVEKAIDPHSRIHIGGLGENGKEYIKIHRNDEGEALVYGSTTLAVIPSASNAIKLIPIRQ